MKMINGAIMGAALGMGGGTTLGVILNAVVPSLHATSADQAVFVATLMYGVGVYGGIMGSLVAGMRERPIVAASDFALERQAA